MPETRRAAWRAGPGTRAPAAGGSGPSGRPRCAVCRRCASCRSRSARPPSPVATTRTRAGRARSAPRTLRLRRTTCRRARRACGPRPPSGRPPAEQEGVEAKRDLLPARLQHDPHGRIERPRRLRVRQRAAAITRCLRARRRRDRHQQPQHQQRHRAHPCHLVISVPASTTTHSARGEHRHAPPETGTPESRRHECCTARRGAARHLPGQCARARPALKAAAAGAAMAARPDARCG